jgi:hypothetical protein
MRQPSRERKSFTVEIRHPSRARVQNPQRISALDTNRRPEFLPASDEIPERDVRADITQPTSDPRSRSDITRPSPLRREQAEALFRPSTSSPPMSARVQEAIRARTAPTGPMVEDDTSSTSTAVAQSPKATTGRILESLLPILDPVQERMAEMAASRGRPRTVNALSGQASTRRRHPKIRGVTALSNAPKPVQQDLPFDKPVSEDVWPDDLAIQQRSRETETPVPSIASTEVASLAQARSTQRRRPNRVALDVAPTPSTLADHEAGVFTEGQRRSYEPQAYRYNKWADQKARRHAPKLAEAYDVTGILHKGEGWKARRLSPRLW